MSTNTTKLNLVKPDESEAVDIGVINDNMDKIDELVHIVAAGTANATRYAAGSTSVTNGTVKWYYQKTDDGLIKAWTVFSATDMNCTIADGDEYRSQYLHINYPSLGQTMIINRDVHVSSHSSGGTSRNWAVDDSCYPTDTGYQTLSLLSFNQETTAKTKYIYMSFVAEWE